MPVIMAPFRKATYRLDYRMFPVADSRGKHLLQLTQELRHLVRGEFQISVDPQCCARRQPARTGTRVTDHRQLDRLASLWARALLLKGESSTSRPTLGR